MACNSPVRVLIVDDEPVLRIYAEDFLSDAGFDTLSTSNADDAVAILEVHREIHIAFTDISMPGSMDGLRLAHVVRRRWPPIAIIITSGFRPGPELPENSRFL